MNIAAVGMVCPVGLSSKAGCAALRAGISAFQELPYWDCENLSVIGAEVPGLGDLQFGPRLVELLTRALRDCMSNAESPWRSVPLLVSLAEPARPGSVADLSSNVVSLVENALGVEFHPRLSQVIAKGHVGGFEGLRIGRELMNNSMIPGFIVCGVDSYINASTIYWLDQNYRLKRENHMDGAVPGEAAGAVYVQRGQGGVGEVEIVGLGFGRERATLLSGEPLLGHGLAHAAKAALTEATWGFYDIDFRVSDVTGETYGFREHTLSEARLVTKVRTEPQPIWHAADCIGDTGAAAGLVQIAWVTAALRKGYAPGPRALCFTSSLSGDRAVAAVCGTMLNDRQAGLGA